MTTTLTTSKAGAKFIGARLHETAATTIPSSTNTVIGFQIADVDTSGFFDGASKLTVPAGLSGVFQLSGQITYTTHADASVRGCFLFVNSADSQTSYWANATPFHTRAQTFGIFSFGPGDVCQLVGYDESGVSLDTITGFSETWFAIQYLGSH